MGGDWQRQPPGHLDGVTPAAHDKDNSNIDNGGDNYGAAILNDATVNPLVTVIATHDDDNAGSTSTTRPAPPAGADMVTSASQPGCRDAPLGVRQALLRLPGRAIRHDLCWKAVMVRALRRIG